MTLLTDDIRSMATTLGDTPKDVRDRAPLLLGFAGAFRRSELIALDVSNFELVRDGAIVTLRRSKTNQEGTGQKIGIPRGSTPPPAPREP